MKNVKIEITTPARRRGRVRVKPEAEPVSVEALLEAAETWLREPEDLALFCALYLTGGRVSEVLGLRKADVEFLDKPVRYRFKLVTLKRGDNLRRIVPVFAASDALARMLGHVLRWLNQKAEEDRVFRWTDSTAACKRIWKVRLAANRVAPDGSQFFDSEFRVHPHFLRHCRNTHLAAAGLPDAALRKLNGWKRPDMAARYTHLNVADLEHAMQEGGG